jgi:flagellar hook-length control protein FliK
MARGVLMDNLPQLRNRLEEQGIRVDQFDVEVAGQETGDFQQPMRQADDEHSPASGPPPADREREEVADERSPSAATHQVIGEKNLNVVI